MIQCRFCTLHQQCSLANRAFIYAYFDTNGDGTPDKDDTTIGDDDENIPWSGIDTDDGVTKGVTLLPKLLCFAGSSGATPLCIPNPGSQRFGRNSWHEVRTN